MDRINGANTILLYNGKRGWVNKNAAAGVPGTQIDATSFQNPLQEELVAGLIEWAGLTPDVNDWTQIQQALLIKFQPAGSYLGGLVKSGIAVCAPSEASVQTATVTFAAAFPGGCSLALAQPISQANSTYGYTPTAAVTGFNATSASFRFDTLTGVGSVAAVDFNQIFYFAWIAWGF